MCLSYRPRVTRRNEPTHAIKMRDEGRKVDAHEIYPIFTDDNVETDR